MKKKIIDAAYVAVIVFSIIFVVRLGFKAHKSGEEAKVAQEQAVEHLKEAREDFKKERDSVFVVIKEHIQGTTSNTLKQ